MVFFGKFERHPCLNSIFSKTVIFPILTFSRIKKIFLTTKNLYQLNCPSWNEPKSKKFVRPAPSAEQKLSKQTATRKSEKKFSRAKNFTGEGVLSSRGGGIKYTKAVNVFGLVTKS